MITLWKLFALPVLYYFVTSILSFSSNLRAARKTGLPILISPVDLLNPLWIIFQKPLVPLLVKLPFGLGAWTRYNTMSWYFTDKYRVHEEYGKVFLKVSPDWIELHSADPEVNAQIFARRKDFEKPDYILQAVTLYGDSISSVTGADWQRHRRITVSPFNERNCRLVWNETFRQASDLGTYWSARGERGLSTTSQEALTLMLNVLATSALGKSWPFMGIEEVEQMTDSEENADILEYRNSLSYLLSSVLFLTMTPLWAYNLPLAFLPGALKKYVATYHRFRRIMTQVIEEKKADATAGNISDETFLGTIVSKSEEFRKQGKTDIDGVIVSGGLSNEEVMGNLFVFNLAGHETTAGSVCYALHLLAIYPETQDWVREEVLSVCRQCEKTETGNAVYDEAFPQLKRCLAVMYETLRLYNPVNSIRKATVGPYGQELVVNGKTVLIPPRTMTAPNVIASGTLPEFWGSDHLEWKPSRWVESPLHGDKSGIEDVLKAENMKPPPGGKDTFIPWSGGARICPGKKFSQVELVSTIATLLRSYRVEVVPRPGETAAQARARCLEVVQDSETEVTLMMKNGASVNLRLVRL
ncbi:unnamed protein product [Discula destructiva]